MPAPKKFTEEKLRMTALAIVDDEGLPALTMRRLEASSRRPTRVASS